MERVNFNFSEKAIRDRRRITMIIGLMMPILLVGTVFVLLRGKGPVDINVMGTFLGAMILALFIQMALVTWIMNKKLRSTKLAVTSDSIVRTGGDFKECIYYNDIESVHIRRGNTGELLFIKLTWRKRRIDICGFESMEDILKILKERLGESTKIIEKQYKINWNSPLMCIAAMIVSIIPMWLFIVYSGNLFQIFIVIAQLFAAGIIFFRKPISRGGGRRFRSFEIVISILILLFVFMSLAAKI